MTACMPKLSHLVPLSNGLSEEELQDLLRMLMRLANEGETETLRRTANQLFSVLSKEIYKN